MATRGPTILWRLALASLIALGAASVSGQDSGLRRLRAMPPERRRELAANLHEFRRLPAEEQAWIRALDAYLANTEPEVRERYQRVLRRYTLWLNSLDDVSRQQLNATPPGGRMAVVRQLLAAAAGEPGQDLDRLLARSRLEPSPSLLDQGYWIRSWYALAPEQKAVIQAASADRRRELLEEYGRANQVPDDRPALLLRVQGELSHQLLSRSLQGEIVDAPEPEAETTPAHHVAEAHVLRDFEPEPVARAALERFESTLPDWVLETLDPLPPAAARARLVILYRLAFPAPQEVPDVGTDQPQREAGHGVSPGSSPPSPVLDPERQAVLSQPLSAEARRDR